MSLTKKIIKEPIRIFADLYYFLNTGFKKPVSFFCNFILPYQNLRIKIDSFLTKLYQNRFMNLEKDLLKKQQLEKMYYEGLIKIENFYNFEDKELLIKLIDQRNLKELEKIIEKTKEKVLKKMIYYLSFLRGENLNIDSLYFSFLCHSKGDALENDKFHSDVFSHSPKAFIYVHDVDLDGRPFLYLISSHKDYKARNDLEKITNKSIYYGTSKFGYKSSRIEENINYQKDYLKKYQKFTGIVKAGSAIFVDTSGFHAKGPGSKPRYTFQVGTKRKNLINKILSIIWLKKFISLN